METKITYVGTRPGFIFKTEWSPTATQPVSKFFNIFKLEYSRDMGILESSVVYTTAFDEWFLAKKLVNFPTLFKVIGKSDSINVETSVITVSSTKEDAEFKLKRSIIEKNKDTGIETPRDKFNKVVEKQHTNALTGDAFTKAAEIETSTPKHKHITNIKAFNPHKENEGKIISLESTSNKEEVLSQYNNSSRVFNPLETNENVLSAAIPVQAEGTKINVTVELENSKKDSKSKKNKATYSPIDFKPAVTVDMLLTEDLDNLSNLIEGIKEKGILQQAISLAKNSRDHDRIRILNEQLRELL